MLELLRGQLGSARGALTPLIEAMGGGEVGSLFRSLLGPDAADRLRIGLAFSDLPNFFQSLLSSSDTFRPVPPRIPPRGGGTVEPPKPSGGGTVDPNDPSSFTELGPPPNSAPFNPNEWLVQGNWTWVPGRGWQPTMNVRNLPGFPGPRPTTTFPESQPPAT